jgi:arabinogalactan oligomer/maltooligosaccharide transport system substrate-binding protein
MKAARMTVPMRNRIASLTVSIFAVGALSAVATPHAVPAPAPITIWVDAARAATVSEFLKDGYQGHPVNVVSKELAAIKAELTTVPADQAPDIIWADNTWTGELAAAAVIIPLTLPPAKQALFSPNVLSGFRYGPNYYGVPVQFETWALVTNAELVPKPPETFAQLSTKALALKAANRVKIGLAVGQGIQGNAYFTYPLFSGLGGYVFGTDASGSLNPDDVGIYNKVFRKNANIIDTWNSTGLINSEVDVAAAEAAFAAGRAPFWITGPWSASTLKDLDFKFFISPLPRIDPGLAMAPLLGIKGFMATSYAQAHGLADVVPDLIVKKLSGSDFQSSMAAISFRAPANKKSTYRDAIGGQLAKAFRTAGRNGVPMPNIPQASSVWGPLSKAWAKSTRGPNATPAKKAFSTAKDKIEKALG